MSARDMGSRDDNGLDMTQDPHDLNLIGSDLVKESFDENTESEKESKAVSENDDGRKREDEESKSERGDLNSEAGEIEGGESNKIEQIESEKSLDENKWVRLVRLKRRRVLKIKMMTLRVVERIRLQLRFFLLDQYSHCWKVCNATARPDCIPCLDNLQAIRILSSTKHYEHRERYCPEEACTCIAPLLKGYKRSIKWPKSGDRVAELNLRMVLFIILTSF
ncbi:hypothetical protein WN944_005012 [Citrus x changshan-huyou]|uniref:Methyltransferase n=1 Tax=Citrus x changshan-huyou TaxID=2935761 RepID=A0AAP0QJ65_9ROSI